MKILNFGSLAHHYIYKVDHFVRPFEQQVAKERKQFPGGKGLFQSVALARAGVDVMHAGIIGEDGRLLKEYLERNGVDCRTIKQVPGLCGHAVIQVNPDLESHSLVFGGTNHQWHVDDFAQCLEHANPGDIVLIQNEINGISELIEQAKAKGLFVVFNVAPACENVRAYPLDLVDIFVMNESQGQTITQKHVVEEVLRELLLRFPKAAFVLTLGSKGARYIDQKQRITIPAEIGHEVSHLAVGDSFLGYFLASMLKGLPVESCLKKAIRAARICLETRGAVESIPFDSQLN